MVPKIFLFFKPRSVVGLEEVGVFLDVALGIEIGAGDFGDRRVGKFVEAFASEFHGIHRFNNLSTIDVVAQKVVHVLYALGAGTGLVVEN